jgi:hypothetical protein
VGHAARIGDTVYVPRICIQHRAGRNHWKTLLKKLKDNIKMELWKENVGLIWVNVINERIKPKFPEFTNGGKFVGKLSKYQLVHKNDSIIAASRNMCAFK